MVEIDRSAAPSRWRLTIAALRAILTAAVLVALYYVLPMDFGDESAFVRLTLGVIVFVGLISWQLREITRADYPGLRAIEGLFLAIPLFLLLFASTYFLMSRSDASSFTAPLSRTDALYFTVTVFSTVGFGDITAQASTPRLVVSAQMLLDLVILGTGVRILLTAVERGRGRRTSELGADSPG